VLHVLVFTLLCTLTSVAQLIPSKLSTRNINLKQGLSQIVVTDLAMDERGFLWVGTFDGLNRFDGSTVKVYRYKPSQAGSLPSSYIFKLFADQNGHVYLRTSGGFSVFDSRIEKTLKPKLFDEYPPQWLTNHDQNDVWVYTKKGELVLVDVSNFTLRRSAVKNKYSAEFCDLIDMTVINGKLYLFSKCGQVLRYDPAQDNFELFAPNAASQAQFASIGLDKYQNVIFASAWNDYVYFNITSNQFEAPSFARKNAKLIGLNDVVYDSISDVLYLSTYGQGLFAYDYKIDSLYQFKKGNELLNLSGNYLLRMKRASNGVLFIGYDGNGLDVIDPFVRQFVPIIHNDSNEAQTIRFVRKLAEDKEGNILIGTAGSGLVKYRRKQQKFEFFPNLYKSVAVDKFVIEMLLVGDELWLGYNGSGVGVVDANSLTLKRVIQEGSKQNELTNGTIWSMLDDSLGNVWIGTRGKGINIVNKITHNVIKLSDSLEPQFAGIGIRTLVLTQKGKVLAGTEKGLFEIDRLNYTVKKVFPFKGQATDESMQSIKSIYEDAYHNYWLGTNGAGILVLDSTFHLFRHLNTENILVNDVIYGILAQNPSSLWISSNMGLSNLTWSDPRLTAKTKIQVLNFDEQNGLQSNEFNTGAYLRLKSNEFVFGGLNGINVFNPADINMKFANVKVYISDFKIFENPLKSDTNISFLDHIDLEHFENSISIGFNVLGFSVPDKAQFQYRLLGYDKNWIDANSRNYVSYTNLNSGNYEFQVRATLVDGTWDSNYTSLKISIATPYYRTWWFISAMILMALQIIYLIYRYRMKQIREKEEMRIQYTKELAEVEMKALRAQINPHFLFNSLNSINNFILRNDTEKASKYLVKFSQLVRSILTNSSAIYISLEEELKTIELYMVIEGMRFSNQFSYEINIDPKINVAVHKVPSLLLQPYVENAIWHGLLHKDGEKRIKIDVVYHNSECLVIKVTDNGIGRKLAGEMQQRTKSHKSFGLQIGEQRLKLMNTEGSEIAKVEVIDLEENGEAIGTKIAIYIPTDRF
jgi:ligand-binding sensor domain-containing protein/two-component sensor histidine kinase